jgi:hypothetical protein
MNKKVLFNRLLNFGNGRKYHALFLFCFFAACISGNNDQTATSNSYRGQNLKPFRFVNQHFCDSPIWKSKSFSLENSTLSTQNASKQFVFFTSQIKPSLRLLIQFIKRIY